MNTSLSSRLHPRKSSFVISCSWSSTSATRAMKAQDTKRAFKPNFPNFPAVRPKEKFLEPPKIWYQNAPNSTQISKTIDFLGKHPCVTRNCAFSLPDSPKIARIFCKQTRIGIIPARKADPNIFLIPWNRITLTLNMLNFPIPCDLFPFSMFYCANEGKMFKNLIISRSLRYSTRCRSNFMTFW